MRLKKWNLLDVALILFIVLAGLTFYFTLVNPIQFSHLIKREGVYRYAEADILLPDDLSWMKEVLPVGEESRDVYERLEWKTLAWEEENFEGKRIVKLRVKLLAVEMSSGIVQYGKYTLVKGGRIILINDRFFIEGRVFDFRLLEERVAA